MVSRGGGRDDLLYYNSTKVDNQVLDKKTEFNDMCMDTGHINFLLEENTMVLITARTHKSYLV